MSKEFLVIMSDDELDKMRAVGQLAAEMLHFLGSMVKPEISTLELNNVAIKWTKAHNAINAPLGYHGFPKSICTSVNEVICHGIPSKKQILKNGDIINIDVTPILDGYHGDTSKTFFVGKPKPKAKKLVDVAEKCLKLAINEVAPNKRIGDIGHAIQTHAERSGFSVVRDFVGHGIGKKFHTEPQIPHYGVKGRGQRLQEGMVFTIEPMVNIGTYKTKILDDGWTAITEDRKLSAQFEHTIVVTKNGFEILTLKKNETFSL